MGYPKVIGKHNSLRMKIKAFFLGIKEFRSQMTTHYDYPVILWYDGGREIAHRITFRKFER